MLISFVQDVVVRQKLEPGTRVTVKMGDTRPEPGENFHLLSLPFIFWMLFSSKFLKVS